MKNQKLFDKTIGILVNAYLNDTLEATECAACAVGNLVAANIGIDLRGYNRYDHLDTDRDTGAWFNAIGRGKVYYPDITTRIEAQIKSTGYTAEELALVELAFMEGCDGKISNFYRLMAVVNTLMQIHEANEEEITQAKRLFVKEPA